MFWKILILMFLCNIICDNTILNKQNLPGFISALTWSGFIFVPMLFLLSMRPTDTVGFWVINALIYYVINDMFKSNVMSIKVYEMSKILQILLTLVVFMFIL